MERWLWRLNIRNYIVTKLFCHLVQVTIPCPASLSTFSKKITTVSKRITAFEIKINIFHPGFYIEKPSVSTHISMVTYNQFCWKTVSLSCLFNDGETHFSNWSQTPTDPYHKGQCMSLSEMSLSYQRVKSLSDIILEHLFKQVFHSCIRMYYTHEFFMVL